MHTRPSPPPRPTTPLSPNVSTPVRLAHPFFHDCFLIIYATVIFRARNPIENAALSDPKFTPSRPTKHDHAHHAKHTQTKIKASTSDTILKVHMKHTSNVDRQDSKLNHSFRDVLTISTMNRKHIPRPTEAAAGDHAAPGEHAHARPCRHPRHRPTPAGPKHGSRFASPG